MLVLRNAVQPAAKRYACLLGCGAGETRKTKQARQASLLMRCAERESWLNKKDPSGHVCADRLRLACALMTVTG